MKKLVASFALSAAIVFLSQCGDNKSADPNVVKDAPVPAAGPIASGGFESQVKWGEHIVTIGGCNDCHTPKKMTPTGPAPDFSLALSGHPAQMPIPDIDRKMSEGKGLVVTNDLTSWVGPWGVSFAANITSDSTGIGNWTEAQFMLCIRQGKWKGLATNRQLLPPMPWEGFMHMTDDELKAVFAYLKSTKPIKNVVPAPLPPVAAMGK